MAVLHRTLDELVAYPPHEPRVASRVYARTRHHLIDVLDAPCWICGIRKTTGGKMETHHAHFEWASQNGLDLEKVTADWPQVTNHEELAEWVDSEGNMLVLCNVHHRCSRRGIHAISYPAWLLQRYEGEEWTFIEQALAKPPRAKVSVLDVSAAPAGSPASGTFVGPVSPQ